MSVILHNLPPDQYYFCIERTFINAEAEGAAEKIREIPHIPAVNKTALDLFCSIYHDKVTAEAKVELLKRAIESL